MMITTLGEIAERVRATAAAGRSEELPLQKYHFDLTGSETHEGFVICCPKNGTTVEEFAGAAIRSVLVDIGCEAADYSAEVTEIDVQSRSGRLGDSTAWLQAVPSSSTNEMQHSEFSTRVKELRAAECLLYIYGVGFAPVQEFVVAQTENQYVAVHWYTTG